MSAASLTARQADVLGRQFSALLMNTNAYGAEHSNSRRASEVFSQHLGACLESHESITLQLEGDTLAVESIRLDSTFNPHRVRRTLGALGIGRVQFRPGTDAAVLRVLMEIITAPEDFPNADAVRAELQAAGVDSIDVAPAAENARPARKPGQPRAQPDTPPRPSAAPARPRPQSENPFDVEELTHRPEEAVRQIMARTWSGDLETLIGQIRVLRDRMRNVTSSPDVPVAVMGAVHKVRAELDETLADQHEIAQFMRDHGSDVLDEVDALQRDTLVAVARCALHHSKAQRDAPVARRLSKPLREALPDARHRAKFLPDLRYGLLGLGLKPADVVALGRALGVELNVETAARPNPSAEDLMIAIKPLADAIRRDPAAAAQMLRRVVSSDRSFKARRLRAQLDPAVQHLTRELMDADGPNGGQSVRTLRQWAHETQQCLLAEIDSSGFDREVRPGIQRVFAASVDQAVDKIRLAALVDQVGKSGDVPEAELASIVAQPFDQEGEFRRIAPALAQELKSLGYSAVRLKRAFEQSARRLRERSRLDLLPDGMLDPNVLAYLLEREIASCRRFGSEFSCMLLMISRLRPADGSEGWRGARPEEIRALLPALFRALPPQLRDIDLLGSLGIRDRNIPLIVLTRADHDGAMVVLQRTLSALTEIDFELDGESIRIETIGAAEQFDPVHYADRKAFLIELQTRLAGELVRRLRQSE